MCLFPIMPTFNMVVSAGQATRTVVNTVKEKSHDDLDHHPPRGPHPREYEEDVDARCLGRSMTHPHINDINNRFSIPHVRAELKQHVHKVALHI